MSDHAHKRAGINKTLGAEEIAKDAEKGWIRMKYLASPDFENCRGVVQGGILSAMLDNAMSSALLLQLEPGEGIASLEMKTTFIGPALSGPLFGEGQIIKRGRSIAFLEGKLFDETDALLVTTTTTGKITRPR